MFRAGLSKPGFLSGYGQEQSGVHHRDDEGRGGSQGCSVSPRLGGRRPWWVGLDPLSRLGTGPGSWHEPQAVVSQTWCSLLALMLAGNL